MSIYYHRIDSNIHKNFLEEGRKDPYTKQLIKHNDQVVFCAGCKSVFLQSSWSAMGEIHCKQRETLQLFPVTKISFSTRSNSGENPKFIQVTSSNDALNQPFSLATPSPTTNSRVRHPNRVAGEGSESYLRQNNDASNHLFRDFSLEGLFSGWGCWLIAFFIIVFVFYACKPQGSKNRPKEIISKPEAKTSHSRNNNLPDFPMAKCGDPSSSKNKFYPVYINSSDSQTLNYIKRNYCNDAFLRTRKNDGRTAIQVASFSNQDRAHQFFEILTLDPQLNAGEVGEASTPEVYSSIFSFPQSQCGDSNPSGLQNFYPVYINSTNLDTLQHLKRKYCNDAYLRTRKDTGYKAIQVASFRDQERAREFVNRILTDSKINNAEVGSPSLR